MPLKILLGRALFGLLFGAAGLAMARLAVLAILRRRQWIQDGVVVEGEIVAFEERADLDRSDLRPLFAPVVTFVGPDGRAARFVSSTAVRPNPYVVGQKIPVRYLRSRPADVDLDSAAQSRATIAVLVTLAIVCLAIALLPIVMRAPSVR